MFTQLNSKIAVMALVVLTSGNAWGQFQNQVSNQFRPQYSGQYQNQFRNQYANQYHNQFQNQQRNQYLNQYHNRYSNHFQNQYLNQNRNSFRHSNGSQTHYQADRYGGGMAHVSPNGNRNGVQFNTNRRGDFVMQGSHSNPRGVAYDAGLSRQGNATRVQGEYRRPSVIPGAQERYNGSIDFRGRDSHARLGGELYDATGRHRIINNQTDINRHGIQRNADARLGDVRFNQNGSASFNGRNSHLQAGQSAQVGRVLQTNMNASANRHRVSAGGNMSVSGAKVGINGSINSRGNINATVNTPTIQTPRVPQISAPRISTPSIPTPRIQTPNISVPKVSTPRISKPRIRF